MTTGKTIALTYGPLSVCKVISLLFNTLSRFIIAFISMNRSLLISWLQSPSTVILRAESLQSYLTLCNPMDCSSPGSSVLGILQARILEWAILVSTMSSSNWRVSSIRSFPNAAFSLRSYVKGPTCASNATWLPYCIAQSPVRRQKSHK